MHCPYFTAALAIVLLALFRVVAITTTLANTHALPTIVRKPNSSPPRKYPARTAITGFT